MKLFRGTAKYLQKTLTFRRNTIVGVFFCLYALGNLQTIDYGGNMSTSIF